MRLKTLSALLFVSGSLTRRCSISRAPGTPLPLPGQLKPLPAGKPAPEPKDPAVRVATANEAARVQPTRDGYINAVQVYPFTEGALYQVYTAPGQVTDIALQESEQLAGPGPVAAGDTARWIIGDTESGTGPSRKVHILAKPTRPDLMTNLVINTDRRAWPPSPGNIHRTSSSRCAGRMRRLKPLRRSRAASILRGCGSATPSRAMTRPGVRFRLLTTAQKSISSFHAA